MLQHYQSGRRFHQKVARVLALAAEAPSIQDNFEGFPGSGAINEHQYEPSQSRGAAAPLLPPSGGSDGRFGNVAAYIKGVLVNTEPDSDDADLEGQLYTRRATSGSSNGSDSRSRTSASHSNPDQSAQNNHHDPTSQLSPHMFPYPHASRSDVLLASEPPRKTKPFKSKSSASHSSKKSSSTSQSPSLQSPVSTSFPISPRVVLPPASEGFPVESNDSFKFPGSDIHNVNSNMGPLLGDA